MAIRAILRLVHHRVLSSAAKCLHMYVSDGVRVSMSTEVKASIWHKEIRFISFGIDQIIILVKRSNLASGYMIYLAVVPNRKMIDCLYS